jgi:hypothetical protein
MMGEGNRAGFEDASDFTDITGNPLGFGVNQRGNRFSGHPRRDFQ